MKLFRLVAGSSLFLVVFASVSQGQAQRTFVSGGGSDANPCSRILPCRTFAQAISQTNVGGEVIVLDSAGYGAFTITTSVSIIASPGVYAGVSVFSGNGVNVSAGTSDTIILRGLTVNNQGSSGSGIVFTSGGTLHVESCVVNGFGPLSGGSGLFFGGPGTLEVKDSVMRGCGHGILVRSSSGSAVASIDHVALQENSFGLEANGASQVTVSNSIASGNGQGFFAIPASAATVQMNLTSCVASNNGDGVFAESPTGSVQIDVESCVVSNNTVGVDAESSTTTIRVSNSTVTGNGTGLLNQGSAALLSRGNNTVEANGTNTAGTIGSYTAK